VKRSLDIAACAERQIERNLAGLPAAERAALSAARSTRPARSRSFYAWNRFIDLACDTEDFIVWSGGSGSWRQNTRTDCSMLGTIEVAYWVDAYVRRDAAKLTRHLRFAAAAGRRAQRLHEILARQAAHDEPLASEGSLSNDGCPACAPNDAELRYRAVS